MTNSVNGQISTDKSFRNRALVVQRQINSILTTITRGKLKSPHSHTNEVPSFLKVQQLVQRGEDPGYRRADQLLRSQSGAPHDEGNRAAVPEGLHLAAA